MKKNGKVKELTVEVVDGVLVISIPMAKTPQPSVSGKTLVVATTHGNKAVPVEIGGQPLFLGVNAYVYR